ncbi:MarR family transcriptional regulator [Noviherbaspirillum cavernae]|uniref:MarR family transcriptional regulator n=2 Tax=Noviherbaspirillum cavernae TaxID=2320862 RepID=A0A418X3S2_9BURK|nr:MarR family transcriptional regulator [Noviherbaspirillum cavernae]RJG07112.1 MarR family transcriptional regulator [Noviherbaspirillum cavernae]
MKERFLRSIRLLAECYHAFEHISSMHVRSLNLTPAQFDIIATLGNTSGMSFKELGERTLITKGTLTGVVARLEGKGLVERSTKPEDRRSMIVRLTAKGQHEFECAFAEHMQYCRQLFVQYSDEEFSALERELATLKQRLAAGNPTSQ